MLLHLYYNDNLLDVAEGWQELELSYMENIALVTTVDALSQTHAILESMTERWGGGFEWAGSHNSRFEMTKSVIMNFSHSRMVSPFVGSVGLSHKHTEGALRGAG